MIETPVAMLVRVDEDFIHTHLELAIDLESGRVSPKPGLHFGSQYPGDPATVAVYDFLPEPLLAQVNDATDFLSVLVFDKWVCNADRRQAVFVRDRRLGSHTESRGLSGFKALMIDQGHTFSCKSLGFWNSPIQGIYTRKVVYKKVTSLIDFEPYFDRLTEIPHSVLTEASKNIPPEWMEGDHGALELLLDKLWGRRKGVGRPIQDCNRSQPSLFPSWRGL